MPLVYIQNRELIDGHLNNASNVINQQATQVRDLAAQHTGRAGEVAKSTMSQYSAKAQDLIGQAKNKTTGTTSSDSTTASSNGPASTGTTSTGLSSEPLNTSSTNGIKREDFPSAPQESFPAAPSAEPIRRTEVPTDPIPQTLPAQ